MTRTLKKLSRPPRKLIHNTVVVSTKTLNAAFNTVFKGLKTITKGTRKISETALMLKNKKKQKRKNKTNKKNKTQRRRRKH